jgi:hypothetical protein
LVCEVPKFDDGYDVPYEDGCEYDDGFEPELYIGFDEVEYGFDVVVC